MAALQPLWKSYFDAQITVDCINRGIQFNVYTAGNAGPVVLCLHGGGYTGTTWALLAQRLKSTCIVIAPDLRAHGLTSSIDSSDLSAATLAADVIALWTEMFGSSQSPPSTIILGHSMGGAIAVHASALPEGISTLQGVAVLDVVEGTALASLPYMRTVLSKRPKSFPDPEAAIKWALDSGASRKREAAEVSVPSMLTLVYVPETMESNSMRHALQDPARPERTRLPSIEEMNPPAASEVGVNIETDGGDSGFDSEGSQQQRRGVWRWRTPLEESSCHWEGWYRGLSDAFLALKVPKILILAGTDRLDKMLTIGQMQGKFQLVLLPRAGHAVHEDDSDAVADVIMTFMKRFKVGWVHHPTPNCS